MKKIYLFAIITCLLMTGCGNKEIQTENDVTMQNTIEDIQEYSSVETIESIEIEGSEIESTEIKSSEIEKEVETEIETVTSEGIISPAKEIFDEYKDDLSRLSFSDFETFENEFVVKDDYIILTNEVVYRKYYLDAAYVEGLKAGDTIEIQEVSYNINLMELTDHGYSVQLQSDEEADWESGKYVYEDIYSLELTEDKQHYYIIFCSDDIIMEKIYEGPIYVEKGAVINAYLDDEVKDISIEEYLNQEYPYISAMEFTVDENTGFITWIQNQIAG